MRARTIRVSRRGATFALVLFLYIVLILGVIRWSPFLALDKDVFRLDLTRRYPEWFYPVHTYVMLGQRAPACGLRGGCSAPRPTTVADG